MTHITRRGLLAGVAAGCAPAILQGQKRPNIVILVGDDHSQGDLGCYGNKVLKTPNLDGVASAGMRCTSMFTATAMCSPSRSTMYTGLYPHRHGCHMNHGAVRAGVKSMPHYLGPLGYRVALAGKTHVRPADSFPFERIPSRQQELDFSGIGKFMAAPGPFCVIVASNDPHSPHRKPRVRPEDVVVPPNFVDTPETRQNLAAYYTDVEHLDWQAGRVLELVDKAGLRDNTLFIYAGDHGYHYFAKWTCYDAGLRVPFLVRWPGVVKAGSVSDVMMSFVDVLPTCMEVAGGKPAAELDGRSFLDVVKGTAGRRQDIIYAAHTTRGIKNGSTYPIRAVRTKEFKYIRNLTPGNAFRNVLTVGPEWEAWKRKAMTDEFAASRVKWYERRPAEELYDLRADTWELKSVASEETHARRLAEMGGLLDRWMKQQGDTGLDAELAVPPHRDSAGSE